MITTPSRSTLYEVWSRTAGGGVQKHGSAFGVTFEDACKHLACESIDFWTHYERGRYRGRVLCETRGQALGGASPDEVESPTGR